MTLLAPHEVPPSPGLLAEAAFAATPDAGVQVWRHFPPRSPS